jgi:hypothetical protein
MYSRIGRFNVSKNVFSKSLDGGIIDYFDSVLKLSFRLYDYELDHLAARLTDTEIGLLIKENKTYREKCLTIIMINKCLNE